jgi:hypothetical protein
VHLQPFLAIQAAELHLAHFQTLATQAAVAEPSSDCRQLAKAGRHGGIGAPAASIQPLGIGGFRTADFALPVERRTADAVPAAGVSRRSPCLLLSQKPD